MSQTELYTIIEVMSQESNSQEQKSVSNQLINLKSSPQYPKHHPLFNQVSSVSSEFHHSLHSGERSKAKRQKDREYEQKGGPFSRDIIQTYIEMKKTEIQLKVLRMKMRLLKKESKRFIEQAQKKGKVNTHKQALEVVEQFRKNKNISQISKLRDMPRQKVYHIIKSKFGQKFRDHSMQDDN